MRGIDPRIGGAEDGRKLRVLCGVPAHHKAGDGIKADEQGLELGQLGKMPKRGEYGDERRLKAGHPDEGAAAPLADGQKIHRQRGEDDPEEIDKEVKGEYSDPEFVRYQREAHRRDG